MGLCRLSEDFYFRHGEDLDEDLLTLVYELLEHSGHLKALFFDKELLTLDEFLDWCWDDSNKIMFVHFLSDGTPISACWFNEANQSCSAAFSHFATLDTAPPEQVAEMARQFIAFIGEHTTLRHLFGMTPTVYRHAIAFSRLMGYKPLTTIEKAVNVRGKYRNALLSVCETREINKSN